MSQTVLLIDDEVHIRSVLGRRFEASGFRTLIASDAEEGLELLMEESPDAIVVDLQMPGMSGLEFGREAQKRCERTPPMVLLTARSHLADDHAVTDSGIDRVMMKPFSAREVVRTIQDLIAAAFESDSDRDSDSHQNQVAA